MFTQAELSLINALARCEIADNVIDLPIAGLQELAWSVKEKTDQLLSK
jgi:hypothetical protein